LVPGVPVPPWTDATWIDLLPTRVPDLDSPAELTRYEDWLALVEVLAAVRPGELRYLGFPSDRQLEIADELARAAARRIEEEEDVGSPASERLRRLLMRAASVPGPRPFTFHVADVLDLEAIDEGADPAASGSLAPDAMASALVGRILSDLG
jgi:hypothetical protein